MIDGQDIAGVSRGSLRHAIAYVGQITHLFRGTIRDNIALESSAPATRRSLPPPKRRTRTISS